MLECWECMAEVDDDRFCFGCGNAFCASCDVSNGLLSLSHVPADHVIVDGEVTRQDMDNLTRGGACFSCPDCDSPLVAEESGGEFIIKRGGE